MTTAEIKKELLEGGQFSNERAQWFTLVSVDKNIFHISIRDEYYHYKNLESCARRISKLMKTGG